jgi:hypothetical protein
MTLLPSVICAEYRGGYRIHLTFNDNSEKTIDFRQWLDGPVFEPLRDPNYFRSFFLEGGTVAWPNGADIAPETLYEDQGAGRRPVVRRANQRHCHSGSRYQEPEAVQRLSEAKRGRLSWLPPNGQALADRGDPGRGMGVIRGDAGRTNGAVSTLRKDNASRVSTGCAFGVVHRARNFEIAGKSHGATRVQATNFANAAKFAPVPELQAP